MKNLFKSIKEILSIFKMFIEIIIDTILTGIKEIFKK